MISCLLILFYVVLIYFSLSYMNNINDSVSDSTGIMVERDVCDDTKSFNTKREIEENYCNYDINRN